MLEVQKFYLDSLYEGGIPKVKEVFKARGVDIRDYPQHSMMLLDYNMFEASKSDIIASQCRGTIIGYNGDIICKPFTRFFNLGENSVSDFDVTKYQIFEKMDGSLVKIYFCPSTNKWEIGTRGTAFAEGPHDHFGTFREGILCAMGCSESEFQDMCEEELHNGSTYLFEFISPFNSIVTPYTKTELVYLSTISNKTGSENVYKERFVNIIENFNLNISFPTTYTFETQEECIKAVESLTGLKEGFVAYNPFTGHRIKIKSTKYVAAHRLRGNGFTANSISEVVALGEVSEVSAIFPNDAMKFVPYVAAYEKIKSIIKELYDETKHIESQKEFAIAIKNSDYSGVLFKSRRDGISVSEALESMTLTKRVEWIRYYVEMNLLFESLGFSLCQSWLF